MKSLGLLFTLIVSFISQSQSWEAWDVSPNGYVATGIYYADIDGDGDQDILLSSLLDNTIGWFENLGGREFSNRRVISELAYQATSVYAIDIDGDGDIDVLSSSRADDEIAWYENLGNGIFGTQHIISIIANNASSVHATDLDGDGDIDVLSASSNDDKIAWYENLGSGIFGNQQVITSLADAASDVNTADIDGDGDQDVISAAYSNNEVAWYENLGSGNFGLLQVITLTTGSGNVCPVDLDLDGDLDIISSSQNADQILFHENLGNSTFSTAVAIASGLTSIVKGVTAYDFDGDGDIDVIAGSNQNAYLIENIGGTTFAIQNVLQPIISYEIHHVDLDQDGLEDFVTAGSDAVGLFFNDGGLSFEYKMISNYSYRPMHIISEDLDCDGDLDILTASENDYKIAWYENMGNGDFTYQKIISEQVVNATHVETADLDNDGDNDILSGSRTTDDVIWFENLGMGQFGPKQIISTLTDGTSNVIGSDLNNDGLVDVISTSTWDDKVAWYENLGGGTFGAQQVISTTIDKPKGLFAADLDNDNDNDLLILGEFGTYKLGWIENLGGGVFASISVIQTLSSQTLNVVAEDLDNDGDLEIIMNGGNIKIFENMSPGVFASPISLASGIMVGIIDVDGDGYKDIVSGTGGSGATETVYWTKNNGNLTFGNPSIIETGLDNIKSITVADLDNDGDGDVMSAERSTNTAHWYENHIFESMTVSGNYFVDVNQNMVFDSGDYPANNQSVSSTAGTATADVNSDGHYSMTIDAPAGNYEVNPNVPNNFAVTNGGTNFPVLLNSLDNFHENLDIAIFPSIIVDSIEVALVPSSISCGQNLYYSLIVTNSGSTLPSGVFSIELDADVTFTNSSVAADSIVGLTYYWSYTNLGYFQDSVIQIVGQFIGSPGDTVTNVVSSNILNGQVVEYSTSHPHNQIADCALGGNSKSVSPLGSGTNGSISDSTPYLDYTINFQNTTDNIVNVVTITDQLDSAFVWNSMQLMSSSHSFTSEINAYGKIIFKASGLSLPTQLTDDQASRGFVTFRVWIDNSTPIGYTLDNDADIKLDCESLTTNSTSNTINYCISIIAGILDGVEVCDSTSVSMTIFDQGLNSTISWDLQGMASSNIEDFNWIADTVGVFDLDLTITNNLCLIDTIVKIIVHEVPPVQVLPPVYICTFDSAFIFNDYRWTEGWYSDSLISEYGCDSVQQQELIFYTPIPIQELTQIYICTGDSVEIFGTIENQPGFFHDTLSNINGCDSIIQQELLYYGQEVVQTLPPISLCPNDSTLIFGNYYSQNGNYYDTLSNVNGCDSILEQQLIIQYLSPNPVIEYEYICQNDSVIIFGNYQSIEAIYYDTIPSSIGCDSIVAIELIQYSTVFTTINSYSVDTTCHGASPVTIPVGSPVGGYYSGAGVSGNMFDPFVAGVGQHFTSYNYVAGNGCITSDSTSIVVEECLDLEEIGLNNLILVYPNPYNDYTNISINENLNEACDIIIYDQFGRIVFEEKEIVKKNYKLNKYETGSGFFRLVIRESKTNKMLFVRKLEVL